MGVVAVMRRLRAPWVGLPLVIDARQLHQGDPVGRLGLGDRLCTEGLAAIREQIFVVGVFVVDGEQGAIRAQGKKLMPSLLSPNWRAWALASLRWAKAGASGKRASPQAISTSAL